MAEYRDALPQLTGGLFLCDGGIETDLIFNHGIEVREFAAHTLLESDAGRRALADYFRPYLELAGERGTGFILDSQTWKAHPHWAADLGASEEELRRANHESIELIAGLRREFEGNAGPIVLCGVVGPRGDAYTDESNPTAEDAQRYHARQLGWLAETEVDMVTATTFTSAGEAAGLVRAAREVGLPAVVSFTVETDGRLPSGQALGAAIAEVDAATDAGAAYFMVNCAHPTHFEHVLEDAAWSRRLLGIRCNASCRSHAELDESETLDAGNPVELAGQYTRIRETLPWLRVFGGCCGSDLRHIQAIGRVVTA